MFFLRKLLLNLSHHYRKYEIFYFITIKDKIKKHYVFFVTLSINK